MKLYIEHADHIKAHQELASQVWNELWDGMWRHYMDHYFNVVIWEELEW